MKRAFFLLAICLIMSQTACRKGTTAKVDNKQENSVALVKTDIFPLQEQHCHGSTVVELPNGDLLAAWFQGSGERKSDDVIILGSRFDKKTGIWCEPFLMADTPDFPDINPVLFIDPQNRLWLVWYTVLAYQWESSILKYRLSDDYMQSTGAPVWKWQDMIHVRPDRAAPEGIGRNDGFVSLLKKKLEDYHVSLVTDGYIREDGSGSVTEEMWKTAAGHVMERAKGLNLIRSGDRKSVV